MAEEDIDLERVVNDPTYRREVLDRLNSEVRQKGEESDGRAVRLEDDKPKPID